MIVTDDSTRIKGKKKLNKRKGQAKIKKNILGGGAQNKNRQKNAHIIEKKIRMPINT